MKIDSPAFGSLDVANNKVIEFPGGLPGFEDCKHFTLIEVADRAQEVAILQGVDRPEIAFSVTTPDLLGLQYEFALTEEEEALLGAARPEDIAVMLILRREDAGEASASPQSAQVRANLTGPLVINVATMRGLQKVIARLGCEVTLRPAD
ncbi:MAG: flagellar biosynthesis protein FliW [Proteobacteria bacterium]|nr:flagellar biosynthesis protein FliW [Pseudomonadota bacterium]